ncbi:hypothetical protein LX97_01214 [Nonlabens dokdonensis]|uniref:DoxX family protein n=2 Tax=Nonlabens dokdonensis TaxID=328515 RepID=L7WCB7_NONDD|nr:hypothetical protein [Nonlabens dokdonensis]AGC76553.1 hypothetical protein DDD_1426 [Nonlabens dokdonensis DSW-6]PZX44204.1 hypothetical protein LX97_01214 [Nonlabens dokdonensis]
MLLSNSTVILISAFLSITYFFSAFEKIKDWNKTIKYYNEMFKGRLSRKLVLVSIYVIIVVELSSILLFLYGNFSFINSESRIVLQYAFIISSILLLVLLSGLRIAKDYQGAAQIGIYFLISIFGLYLMEL